MEFLFVSKVVAIRQPATPLRQNEEDQHHNQQQKEARPSQQPHFIVPIQFMKCLLSCDPIPAAAPLPLLYSTSTCVCEELLYLPDVWE